MMYNFNKLIKRYIHIDIQPFALKEWFDRVKFGDLAHQECSQSLMCFFQVTDIDSAQYVHCKDNSRIWILLHISGL